MFEKNYDVLCQVVAEKKVIRHVSKHRLPDGKFDLDGNMKIWNDALELFDVIKLWENGTPNYDAEKTPLQPEPSIIFVPAVKKEEEDRKRGIGLGRETLRNRQKGRRRPKTRYDHRGSWGWIPESYRM